MLFCLQFSIIILLAYETKFGESLLLDSPLDITKPLVTPVTGIVNGVKNFTEDLGTLTGGLTENIVNLINNLTDNISNLSEDLQNAMREIFNFTGVPLLPDLTSTLKTKCCGKYGCFTVDPPFGFTLCRPLMVLPMCQNQLNVEFYLWTRDNLEKKYVINPENFNNLNDSLFRANSCVLIYINGYLGSGDMFFVRDMKDAYLKKRDCMFVSVEWVNGSRLDYITSTANAQMVGAVTAYFMKQLMVRYNISAENFHIVALSLGAHVAAEIGKRINGIGRITGLDPAKPLFQGCDATVRLSNTDALFVDILHTDLGAFGSTTPSGHVDIYINGGYSQPACFGLPICGHLLTVFYFIDTIEADCPYLAYQCDDQESFERGLCSIGCGDDGSECIPMGFHADVWKKHIRKSPTFFYMSIGDKKHYCVYHYYVEINCTDDEVRLWRYGRNQDKLFINLIGTDNETGLQPANERSIRYTTLPTIKTLIFSKNQIGQIVRIKLKWAPSGQIPSSEDCKNGNITEPTDKCCALENFDVRGRCLMCPFIVTSIYVKNLETNNSFSFLGGNKTLIPDEEVAFEKQGSD